HAEEGGCTQAGAQTSQDTRSGTLRRTGYWLTPAATAGRSGRCPPRPPGTPSPTATPPEPHPPRARPRHLSVPSPGNSSVLRVAGATPGHPVPLGGILESAGELAARPSALVNRVHGGAWVRDSGLAAP